MNDEKEIILFTVLYKEIKYQVLTSRNEYYSLMTLIADRLAVPEFGLCSGMGSCGTCLVEIYQQHAHLKRLELSCSVQINDDLNNAIIVVPAESC